MEQVDLQLEIKQEEKPKTLITVDTNAVLDEIKGETKQLFATPQDQANDKTETFLRDLVDGTVNLVNLSRQERYDTLVFLDKSARPVVNLFMGLWNEVFPNDKKPRIRFLNVFTNDNPTNDYSPETLEELEKSFKRDVESKKVLVVDEYVSTGRSLGQTKYILNRTFGKTQDITYTGVLKHSWVSWRVQGATENAKDTPRRGVGIVDRGIPVVLHSKDGSEIVLPVENSRSFISKGLVSEVKKTGARETAEQLQQQVNELRGGLKTIANLIAKHSEVSITDESKVKPYLPDPNLEKIFNGNKFL